MWICCAHRIERGRAQLAGGGGGEGTHTEDAMHQTWGAMAEHGDLFFHWFLKAPLYSKQGGPYYIYTTVPNYLDQMQSRGLE